MSPIDSAPIVAVVLLGVAAWMASRRPFLWLAILALSMAIFDAWVSCIGRAIASKRSWSPAIASTCAT